MAPPTGPLPASEPTHPLCVNSQAMRVYLDFIRRRHMYLESDGRNLGSKYTLKRILECSDYHFATRYAKHPDLRDGKTVSYDRKDEMLDEYDAWHPANEPAADGGESFEIQYTAKEAGDFELCVWCDPQDSEERQWLTGSPFLVRVTGVLPSCEGSFVEASNRQLVAADPNRRPAGRVRQWCARSLLMSWRSSTRMRTLCSA